MNDNRIADLFGDVLKNMDEEQLQKFTIKALTLAVPSLDLKIKALEERVRALETGKEADGE